MFTKEANTKQARNFLVELLARSAQQEKEINSILSVWARKGQIDCIERGSFRLFFLLAGEVCLLGEQYGKNTIHTMEFALLPPSESICCEVMEDAQYIVLPCVRAGTSQNTGYLKDLRKLIDKNKEGYASPLPIREKLKNMLHYLSIGIKGEFQYYFPVYDTLLLLLRLSYSKEEMALLFGPMIVKNTEMKR